MNKPKVKFFGILSIGSITKEVNDFIQRPEVFNIVDIKLTKDIVMIIYEETLTA